MSHFIENCKNCKKVISQCRCPSPDKEQRWGVCESCKKNCGLTKEGMDVPEGDLPTYCAWCKRHMSGPIGDYKIASHGICPPCLKELQKEMEATTGRKLTFEKNMTFREFLARKLAEK